MQSAKMYIKLCHIHLLNYYYYLLYIAGKTIETEPHQLHIDYSITWET